jgi:hypothetical protein
MQNYSASNNSTQVPLAQGNNFQSVKRLAVIAIFQNLLFVGLFYVLVIIPDAPSSQGGFAGLAFLLAYITAISYITQFAVVMVSGMLLKRAGFSQPFKIAIVAFILSLLGGLVSAIVLEGQSQIVTILIGLVASIIYFLVAYWLIKVSKNKRILYIVIPVSLVIVGAVIFYAQIPLANRYLKKTNSDKIAKLDFEVYKPSYLPAGFRQGPDYIETHFEKITAEYSLLNGNTDHDKINVYQGRHTEQVDKLILPPDICYINIANSIDNNPPIPSWESGPCTKKTTPGGVAYYRQDVNNTGRRVDAHWFYFQKGKTAIFMEFSYANFRYSESFEPELQKIIDSFQPQAPESLMVN